MTGWGTDLFGGSQPWPFSQKRKLIGLIKPKWEVQAEDEVLRSAFPKISETRKNRENLPIHCQGLPHTAPHKMKRKYEKGVCWREISNIGEFVILGWSTNISQDKSLFLAGDWNGNPLPGKSLFLAAKHPFGMVNPKWGNLRTSRGEFFCDKFLIQEEQSYILSKFDFFSGNFRKFPHPNFYAFLAKILNFQG